MKQALNYGLVLKKVHKVIRFNQNAWLKPYIDININLRKKAQNDLEKYFYKLINNAVLEKLWKMREEEIIEYQNQIIMLQSSSQKIY